jgi:uncharacterized protein
MRTLQTAAVPGTVCWVDLLSSDPPRAISFYGALFGWVPRRSAGVADGYVVLEAAGETVAGLASNIPESGVPDGWSIFVGCDDLPRAERAAAAGGGEVAVQAMPIAESGRASIAIDPAGAAVGLWDLGRRGGFERSGGPDSAIWYELVTRDYDAALEFYADALGWSAQPLAAGDEIRYSFCAVGDRVVAGVLDGSAGLEAGAASYWQVFFGVADVDSALARVVELGGTVLHPAWDTEFGRRAVVADPTGARFGVASIAGP